MKRFELDRARWFRGKGPLESALLREDGGMCCLGLYLEACGVPQSDLLKRKYPSGVDNVPSETHWCWRGALADSDTVGEIASTNDKIDLPETERERRIVRLFRTQGIDLVFVDSSGPSPSGGEK